MIDAVVVAVPARDEEELLPGALAAVTRAQAAYLRARAARPAAFAVVVALDGCTDGTGEVARAAGAATVPTPAAGVGVARDAAVRHGLALLGADPERTWIACTDADTLVPESWFATQLALADGGVDVVVGTVEPVGAAEPELVAAWHARHELAEDHGHVHGANLGVRASTYLRIGGFPAAAVHEDVLLVERARAAGAVVVATDTTRVRTSARLAGRVEDGFAGYLRGLAAAPAVTSRVIPLPARAPDLRRTATASLRG